MTEYDYYDPESVSSFNGSAPIFTREDLEALRNRISTIQNDAYRNERIFYSFAYGLIIIFSFFGNLLVCRVCLQNMSATNALIMSLGTSDLLMTVFNIPVNLYRIMNYSWPFGRSACFLANFLQHLVVYISSYTFVIIAIERYRSICGLQFTSKSPTPAASVGDSSFRRQQSIHSNRAGSVELAKTKCGLLVSPCRLLVSAVNRLSRFSFCCGQCRPPTQQRHPMRTIVIVIILIWIFAAFISALSTYSSRVVERDNVFGLVLNDLNSGFSRRTQDTPTSTQNRTIDELRSKNITDFELELKHFREDAVLLRCQNNVPESLRSFLQQYDIKADLAISVATFIAQYVVPLTISCCLYIQIGKVISAQGKMVTLKGNAKARTRQRRKRRRIIMLVLVVTVFGICWLPLNLFHLLIDADLINYNSQIFMMVHWLAMSSVSYNSLILCWFNKAFRKAWFDAFSCCLNLQFFHTESCRRSAEQRPSNNDQQAPDNVGGTSSTRRLINDSGNGATDSNGKIISGSLLATTGNGRQELNGRSGLSTSCYLNVVQNSMEFPQFTEISFVTFNEDVSCRDDDAAQCDHENKQLTNDTHEHHENGGETTSGANSTNFGAIKLSQAESNGPSCQSGPNQNDARTSRQEKITKKQKPHQNNSKKASQSERPDNGPQSRSHSESSFYSSDSASSTWSQYDHSIQHQSESCLTNSEETRKRRLRLKWNFFIRKSFKKSHQFNEMIDHSNENGDDGARDGRLLNSQLDENFNSSQSTKPRRPDKTNENFCAPSKLTKGVNVKFVGVTYENNQQNSANKDRLQCRPTDSSGMKIKAALMPEVSLTSVPEVARKDIEMNLLTANANSLSSSLSSAHGVGQSSSIVFGDDRGGEAQFQTSVNHTVGDFPLLLTTDL